MGVVAFAEEKYRLDVVGLVMSLPEGAQAQSTSIGGRQNVQIVPKETNWVLNVQTPRTSNAEATIEDAAEKTITLLQGSVGVLDPDQKSVLETEARLIERNDHIKLAGGPASRFYISLPNPDKTRIVKGYTIFKPTSQQYVVFELITSEIEFPKVKSIYETVIGTASFADSEAVMAERGIFVKAGAAFLAGLTEADYVQAMHDNKIWQRLSKPAPTGAPLDAEEIGYRGIRFWRGRRGEVDPAKPKASYGTSEQEEGYLCSIEGRTKVRTQWADTTQIYFLSTDRQSETWSIKMVAHDENGREIGGAKETGARDGTNLTIVTTEKGRSVQTVSPPVPEGYVSQFESFLLPRLLIRRKMQTTTGLYCWMTNKSVSFRKDDCSREGGGRGTVWTIKTTFRDDESKQTYTFNDKGDLIRGEVEAVGVWEPMEPHQIQKLWEQKGLPTGKLATGR